MAKSKEKGEKLYYQVVGTKTDKGVLLNCRCGDKDIFKDISDAAPSVGFIAKLILKSLKRL